MLCQLWPASETSAFRAVTTAGLSGAELRWTYAVDISSALGNVTQLTVDTGSFIGASLGYFPVLVEGGGEVYCI